MDMLCKQNPTSEHHVVILPGVARRYMIDKIPYLFRQDTDMLYMSGCLEPDCVLLLHTVPSPSSPPSFKSLIFTPPYDPSKELWDGPRTPPSGAFHVWGVDEGLPLTELARYLASVEKELRGPNLWYNFASPPNADVHSTIHQWALTARKGGLQSPKQFIHALRVVKSPAEVKLMRETCRISAESIRDTIRTCKAPTFEHQLFATVDYQCRTRGAEHLAYPPVVAGGNRANVIHYISNNNVVLPGEMVLMDAGSEYRGYSGDITRTWPVNGRFSSAQRDLYEAVLEVQKYVIETLSERPSLNQLFAIMCLKLGKALQELCILPRDMSDNQLSRVSFRDFI
ncbi:UNVERIFIED_CONTAM: hypothetical protein GTU68_019448 [Idotea baltica]|nr:hypothetical protein [Idotea baltica]